MPGPTETPRLRLLRQVTEAYMESIRLGIRDLNTELETLIRERFGGRSKDELNIILKYLEDDLENHDRPK